MTGEDRPGKPGKHGHSKARLCGAAGTTTRTLARAFRAVHGITPVQYLHDLRLTEARKPPYCYFFVTVNKSFAIVNLSGAIRIAIHPRFNDYALSMGSRRGGPDIGAGGP